MSAFATLPRYDTEQTYDWNYDNPPPVLEVDIPALEGDWTFCGRSVSSPLGIPAGPLLNGRWILYYAALGFDVLTYKTVRSLERACYPLPNLQPVTTGTLDGSQTELPASDSMSGSWAVSFGMPSKGPDVWRADIEWTRDRLPDEKILVVSVVASVRPDWSIENLGDDYARCAAWAVESGADAVETNFSCPNVSTSDGQLYQQPQQAAIVAERVRSAIGSTPYLAKIGHVTDRESASQLLDALSSWVDALAMTNSVAARIRGTDGSLLFDGEKRGICGTATRVASTVQTRLFRDLIDEKQLDTRLIGVGGARTADDVRAYLAAGAEGVHLATSGMVDPAVAIRIRGEWSSAMPPTTS